MTPTLILCLAPSLLCRDPLTNADRLLGVPEGLGGIEAGEEPGTLQLVAGGAVEVGAASWVEAGDSHITISRTSGKVAAQEIGYGEREREWMTMRRAFPACSRCLWAQRKHWKFHKIIPFVSL